MPKSCLPMLAKGEVPRAGVYLLAGTDPSLSTRVMKLIRSQYLDPGLEDLNLTRIEATKDTTASALWEAGGELPMLSSHRVLEVRGLEAMLPAAQEDLAARLAKWPAETILVARVPIKGDDESVKGLAAAVKTLYRQRKPGEALVAPILEKAFKTHGACIRCALKDNEVRDWLKTRFQELGVTPEAQAIGRLVEMVGNNAEALDNEARKLASFAGERGKVTVAAVKELASPAPESRLGFLVRALEDGNLARALEMWKEMDLHGSVHPLQAISYLNTVFSRRMAQDQGPGPAKPTARARSTAGARKSPGPDNRRILDLLLLADQRLKSGYPENLIMELLMFEICRRKG